MGNAKDCSDHANRNNIVRLQSSDGQIIEVEEAVASISWIINAIMKDLGTHAVIPLPRVSTAILKLVMEYCTFHALHDPEYRPQISKEEEEEYWRRITDEEEQQKSLAADEEQNMMADVSGLDDEEQNMMADVSGLDDEGQNRMGAVVNRMAAVDDEEQNRMEPNRMGEKRRAVEQKRRADMWEWDDEFVKKMDMGTLCEVVEASDYLNVLKLRDLVAQCCGKKIMEKTMELFHSHRRRKLSFPIRMGKTKESWG